MEKLATIEPDGVLQKVNELIDKVEELEKKLAEHPQSTYERERMTLLASNTFSFTPVVEKLNEVIRYIRRES